MSKNGSVLVPVTNVIRRVMQRMRKDLLQLPDQFVLELGEQNFSCMRAADIERGMQYLHGPQDVADS
jgi:hypothetical protein